MSAEFHTFGGRCPHLKAAVHTCPHLDASRCDHYDPHGQGITEVDHTGSHLIYVYTRKWEWGGGHGANSHDGVYKTRSRCARCDPPVRMGVETCESWPHVVSTPPIPGVDRCDPLRGDL